MRNHLKNSLCLGCCLVLLLLQSCYDPTSGCLDTLSSNYNVAAEEECDDCCTYPKITLQFNHLWKGESFVFRDTLINDIGSRCILLDSKFHLSDFSYTLTDDSQIANRDSTSILLLNRDTTIANDIVLLRKNQTTGTLHSYRSSGTVSNYSFQLGVPNELDSLTELNAEKYGDLAYGNGMRNNDKYAPFWFQIVVGGKLDDTITVFGNQDYTFDKDIMVEIEDGSNVAMPLTINYDLWMKEIAFAVDDADEIANKMSQNATKAFEQ